MAPVQSCNMCFLSFNPTLVLQSGGVSHILMSYIHCVFYFIGADPYHWQRWLFWIWKLTLKAEYLSIEPVKAALCLSNPVSHCHASLGVCAASWYSCIFEVYPCTVVNSLTGKREVGQLLAKISLFIFGLWAAVSIFLVSLKYFSSQSHNHKKSFGMCCSFIYLAWGQLLIFSLMEVEYSNLCLLKQTLLLPLQYFMIIISQLWSGTMCKVTFSCI